MLIQGRLLSISHKIMFTVKMTQSFYSIKNITNIFAANPGFDDELWRLRQEVNRLKETLAMQSAYVQTMPQAMMSHGVQVEHGVGPSGPGMVTVRYTFYESRVGVIWGRSKWPRCGGCKLYFL